LVVAQPTDRVRPALGHESPRPTDAHAHVIQKRNHIIVVATSRSPLCSSATMTGMTKIVDDETNDIWAKWRSKYWRDYGAPKW